jgi:hypothetical protein
MYSFALGGKSGKRPAPVENFRFSRRIFFRLGALSKGNCRMFVAADLDYYKKSPPPKK